MSEFSSKTVFDFDLMVTLVFPSKDMLLWNYLEVRDDNHWLLTLDLEDVFDIQEMGLLSGYETDDESDLSDYAENLIG